MFSGRSLAAGGPRPRPAGPRQSPSTGPSRDRDDETTESVVYGSSHESSVLSAGDRVGRAASVGLWEATPTTWALPTAMITRPEHRGKRSRIRPERGRPARSEREAGGTPALRDSKSRGSVPLRKPSLVARMANQLRFVREGGCPNDSPPAAVRRHHLAGQYRNIPLITSFRLGSPAPGPLPARSFDRPAGV